MWEPRQPIHARRADRFRPPHCPWPECEDHTTDFGYRATRKGYYSRLRDRKRVPRFLCGTCGRTFSRDAFATTYYLKRPELLLPIASLLVNGCAHRQIARHLGCAPSTVTNLSVRLGRHGLLFQRFSAAQVVIDEPVVLDHFETFVRSQQERLGIATAVGRRSWFVQALHGAGYLRQGRRSRRKRALKTLPKQPPPGELLVSTLKTLENLLRRCPGGLDLVSDDHPAYRAAIRRLALRSKTPPPIRHIIHANPDRSPGHDREQALQRDWALFGVDLLHKLLRHSQKHHGRETIAFGRRRPHVIGRFALFAVWRNMIKKITERRPTRFTPAMLVGLTSRPWTWAEVFAERLFERRVALRTA